MSTKRPKQLTQAVTDPIEIDVSDLGAIPPGLMMKICGWLNAVGGIVIFALMLLINGDVFGRSLLNQPISGVPEMVELAIVVIVFLQVANSVGAGRFIRSDELHKQITRRSARTGNFLAMLYELVGAALLGTLSIGTTPVLLDSWKNDLYVGNPGVFSAPVWPVQLAIVVGSGLAAVVFLYAAYGRLEKIKATNTEV